jgi:hypothetical protein
MSDTCRCELVVGQVEQLQLREIFFSKAWDRLNIVILKVDVYQRLQVAELLQPHLII